MRVLGIDPGLRFTGYAVVELGVIDGDASLVEAGVIRLKPGMSVADRLVELERDLVELMGRLEPTAAAVEKLYAHYKHPTTAIVMGHARGVVLLAARRNDMELRELGATEVKKSMTGHGHASKAQIQSAVCAQLGLAGPPEPADVADAIAIALTGARRAAAEREGGVPPARVR